MLTQREHTQIVHIDFNKLPLPPDHYRILHAMLPLCKTKMFLKKNYTYKGIEFIDIFGQPRTVDVSLSHQMWHFVNDRNEDRDVIMSETLIGEGARGKVSEVLYTVEALNTINPLIGSVKLKNYNERAIKIQTYEKLAIEEVKFMHLAGHLGAKKLVIAPANWRQQKSASIMAKVGTESLTRFICSTSEPSELYEETINIIQAHIEQNINNHIIHKDINPDNIRRDSQTHRIYFIDYGLSTSMNNRYGEISGTPYYRAPEFHNSTKLDTFSLAVTLTQIWKGSTSFKHVLKLHGQYYIPNLFKDISDISLPNQYKQQIKEILNDMLNYNFNARITAETALARFEDAYSEFITRSNPEQKKTVLLAFNLAKLDKQLESKIDIEKFKELLLSRWDNFTPGLQREAYLKALGIKEIRNVTTKDTLMDVIDKLNNNYKMHIDHLSEKLRQLEEVKNGAIALNSEYEEFNKIITKQKQKTSTLTDVINFEQKYEPRMKSIQESLLGLISINDKELRNPPAKQENKISAPAGTTSNITSASTSITSDGVDVITICNKIDAHINKLKFGWNPFKSSAKAKITALEKLKKALTEYNHREKIKDVISKWLSNKTFQEAKTEIKVSTETVISQHRFIFLSETRNQKATHTQIFINDLTNDFRDKILKRNG
jgi:serine/threonine protein kinase